MADSLDMNHLSLNDSKHANVGPPPGSQNAFPARAAYVPPHARQASRSMMNNGMDGSAWGPGGYVDYTICMFDNKS